MRRGTMLRFLIAELDLEERKRNQSTAAGIKGGVSGRSEAEGERCTEARHEGRAPAESRWWPERLERPTRGLQSVCFAGRPRCCNPVVPPFPVEMDRRRPAQRIRTAAPESM